jgi:alpha/beta superfamily hydrolase
VTVQDRPEGAEVRAPGVLRMALEWRAPLELGVSLAALPILRSAPAGDGHPVLVFPGLAASDISTGPLRSYLKDRNYIPHRWQQGRNFGPGNGVLEACGGLVKRMRERYGRKVSLIGWSLGGIYAREAARTMPDDVRCVITLGTPFAGDPRATNAWRLYEYLSGEKANSRHSLGDLSKAPPVPTTSIYSRTDGIVAWQCSVQEEGPQAENIEVEASHFGLGVNPAVLYAIADRLAQPEGSWSRFDRSGLKALIYRDPATADWFPASSLV